MSGLPESFDVAKRIGLFVYLTRNAGTEISVDALFSKYNSDLDRLSEALSHFRSQCPDRVVMKRFESGLVTSQGLTSFNKYLRMAHWLGILELNLNTKTVRPTWKTAAIIGFCDLFNVDRYTLEVPSALKLFFTKTLIETDLLPIYSMVNTARKNKTHIEDLSSTWFQRNYALELKSSITELLSSTASEREYSGLFRRYRFIEKNLNLFESGASGTRGLKHMIEPRIHWLLDLYLIDYDILCISREINPIKAWDFFNVKEVIRIDSLDQRYNKINDFYSEYLRYINSQSCDNCIVDSMDLEEASRVSLRIFKRHFPEFVEVEAVIALTWVLSNMGNKKYVSLDEITNSIENLYPIYRRKLTGLGFISSEL